jgi:hypothetical protein
MDAALGEGKVAQAAQQGLTTLRGDAVILEG